MTEHVCFMLEETGRRWHSYGRFEKGPCTVHGDYHHATSYVDDVDTEGAPDIPEDGDPRVPTTCDCGHIFSPHTTSTSSGRWYRDPRDGSTFRHLAQAPAGAMWYAPYLLDGRWSLSPEYIRDHEGKRPPVVVQLPAGGAWCVDERARSNGQVHGTGWTVTGEAPKLTASPSILTPSYHGFLTDGVLRSC